MEKETAYPVLFLDPDHGFLVGPEVPENRQPLPPQSGEDCPYNLDTSGWD